MRGNGSPPPRFKTDDDQTYFYVELAVHPSFHKAHDKAHDKAAFALTRTELQIVSLLKDGEKSRRQVIDALGYSSRSGFLYKATARLRDRGLVEFTVPDKPRSRNQRMRLTDEGRRLAADFDRQTRGE